MEGLPVKSAAPAYPVAAVGNVLELILLLEERRCVKLTDVSARLGVGPSTAHRLLAMFRHFGFVEQEERSHTYRVGPALLTVSKTLALREAMLAQVRPLLESLVNALNETVHVATLRGSTVIYIDCVESRKFERATPRIGRTMPSYATASGKALLADLSGSDVRALFPSTSLAPLTARTHSSRESLLEDLCRTRRRGFSINESESQLGFVASACTIKTQAACEPIAFVVAAPSQRFRKNLYRCADRLCTAAEEARRALDLAAS